MSQYDPSYSPDRLLAAQRSAAAAGLDALLITPGGDLRYLAGYDAVALERLTCLVLPATGDPILIVPRLERPAAEVAPGVRSGMTIADYPDGSSPYPLVARALRGAATGALGISNTAWAQHVVALRDELPGWRQELAGETLSAMRIRKEPGEIAALRRAAEAIDAVHADMARWLRPGRTEADVAADIASAMRRTGHSTVEFTIVASGPNSASPHHGTSNRIVERGDVVVVDIGGKMPDGYCSDCTRTYVVGGRPDARFMDAYELLRAGQAAAVNAVRPGVTAEAVDATVRRLLDEGGYGKYFLHRTGHGIGLDVHEDPYIVAGNRVTLEPGMAFSVEPGVYLAGSYGARIEDIVICTASGVCRLNTLSTELVIL